MKRLLRLNNKEQLLSVIKMILASSFSDQKGIRVQRLTLKCGYESSKRGK